MEIQQLHVSWSSDAISELCGGPHLEWYYCAGFQSAALGCVALAGCAPSLCFFSRRLLSSGKYFSHFVDTYLAAACFWRWSGGWPHSMHFWLKSNLRRLQTHECVCQLGGLINMLLWCICLLCITWLHLLRRSPQEYFRGRSVFLCFPRAIVSTLLKYNQMWPVGPLVMSNLLLPEYPCDLPLFCRCSLPFELP